MGEHISSTTVLLIFLIILLFFIVIDILFSNGNNSSRNNNNHNNEQQDFANQERIKKRLRAMYWQNLGIIYDDKPNEVLEQANVILQKMLSYHNPAAYRESSFHDVDIWYLELGKLRNILSYPIWVDDNTDPNTYEMPLFPDLDIQYIEDLLDERLIRNKGSYTQNKGQND